MFLRLATTFFLFFLLALLPSGSLAAKVTSDKSAVITEAVRLYPGTNKEFTLRRGDAVLIDICITEGEQCLVQVDGEKVFVPGSALQLEDGRTALEAEAAFWSSARAKSAERMASIGGLFDIAAWGDSLTRGSGASPGNSYPEQMEAGTARFVYNYGMSGESVDQIHKRFSASAESHKHTTVIWAGRNDVANVLAPSHVPKRVQDMVDMLPHDRFLVLGVTNGSNEPVGSDAFNRIVAINEMLKSQFGDRFIDVRVLINDSAGAEEQDADNMDLPPPSMLADNIHFNDAGYKVVADAVLRKIREFGW